MGTEGSQDVVGDLPVFKLERYLAKYEFTAPYIACASDVQGVMMKDLIAMADEECRELWENLSLMYTESNGHPLLREEIVKRYYPELTREEVEVLCPQEGIFLSMKSILNSSDHVIAISPSYQSLSAVAASLGCEVSLWRPKERTDISGQPLQFDVADLESLVRPNTRLVVVNFPHNPTGFLPSQDEWQRITSLCRERDMFLFSDEMYHGLESDSSMRLPSACTIYDKAVTLSGMSKTFGMPGVRLGWLACRDPEFRARVSLLKDYTTICPPAPSEVLALIALRNKDVLVERSLRVIREGTAAVQAFMDAHKDTFAFTAPSAGPIAFPKLIGGTSEDVAGYAQQLMESCGILILPGNMYSDEAFGNRFRIALGRDNIPQIMQVWDDNYIKLGKS